jgi:hypothetical protein
MKEPVRLRDLDSQASELGRTLLASVEIDAPSDAELASLSRRLDRARAGSTGGRGGALYKIGGLVLLVVAGSFAIHAALRERREQRRRPDAPAVHEEPVASPRVGASGDREAPEQPSAGSFAEPRTPIEPPRAAPEHVSPPERLEDGSAVEAELALLHRARSALRNGEIVDALSLIEQHERRYRASRFLDERERIAVEALARSGRAAEARARFDDLVVRNPDSPYRRSLERTLGVESDDSTRMPPPEER